MAVTVNATECWDLPALEEIRVAGGLAAVRAAMAAGDVPAAPAVAVQPPLGDLEVIDELADWAGSPVPAASEPARPVVFGNGFILSPYAETGAPGGSLKNPPRTLWHASPGSTATPD